MVRLVKSGIYKCFIKRFLDVVLAILAIIILSPVFILLAVLIRCNLGKPILFKQKRPGYLEKPFTFYKFRTMTQKKDTKGNLLPDQDRLTRLGKILRATSLDELPELYNILRGDMSFIGPRLLLMEYLPLYNLQQRRRHEVRPGISGLAQVNGRNMLSWSDKFKLDVRYVDHVTFVGDLRLLFQTFRSVLKKEGIHSATAQTMEVFRGNEEEFMVQNGKPCLVILGCGGHGKSVADVALQMKRWKRITFLDDNIVDDCMGIKVLGPIEDFLAYMTDSEFIVAIGNNKIREAFTQRLLEAQATMALVIHPSAVIGEKVTIGEGTVVMAGAVINCCTTIGKGCIINTGATIDHDDYLDNFIHIAPGTHLAGNVKVGDRGLLGIGSVVSNNITITSDCFIGAGTLVIKDITEAGTYIGVPARRLR